MSLMRSTLSILAALLTLFFCGLALFADFFTMGRRIDDFSRLTFFAVVLTLSISAFFMLIPWSGWKYRERGINEHFRLVFTIIAALQLPLVLVSLSGWMNSLLNIFTLVVAVILLGINFTILFYHFQDSDPLPPSHFASGDYLREQNK